MPVVDSRGSFRVQSGLEISSHCRALPRSVENPWSGTKLVSKPLNLQSAAGPPPRAGRTFFGRYKYAKAGCGPAADVRLIAFIGHRSATTVLTDINRRAIVKIPMRRQR